MKVKKIATNIPVDLINEASELTGLNQTQTIILGLSELIALRKRQELLKLKGKVKIELDVKRSRQRKKT